MSKVTIEVEMDKLTARGQAALRALMGDMNTVRPEAAEPQDATATLKAAVRLAQILDREPQGNQKRVVRRFVTENRPWLTYTEIVNAAGKDGPALAGTLSSLTKNWRKAGMPGRRAIRRDWQERTVQPGAFWLADGDMTALQALQSAMRFVVSRPAA
jgi:hypothetical protein